MNLPFKHYPRGSHEFRRIKIGRQRSPGHASPFPPQPVARMRRLRAARPAFLSDRERWARHERVMAPFQRHLEWQVVRLPHLPRT